VYSIEALARLPLSEGATRFEPDAAAAQSFPAGFSADGIAETFSTTPPLSLYGATKLASEVMALEYGADFNFPVWVNRCGVIGGPGQFGKADQGIFSFWVYSAVLNRPLAYIGFGGSGKQVRDCVLPEDVADLVLLQMKDPRRAGPRIFNVGGGAGGALSLRETTAICESFFGRSLAVLPSSDARPYDIAYYVSDTRRVRETWGWKPSTNGEAIVRDLCRWASENADYIRSWF
jgi:CDP-paratose 2-epimerase